MNRGLGTCVGIYPTLEGEQSMFMEPSLPKEKKIELALIAINVLSGVGVPKEEK